MMIGSKCKKGKKLQTDSTHLTKQCSEVVENKRGLFHSVICLAKRQERGNVLGCEPTWPAASAAGSHIRSSGAGYEETKMWHRQMEKRICSTKTIFAAPFVALPPLCLTGSGCCCGEQLWAHSLLTEDSGLAPSGPLGALGAVWTTLQ